jgi:hypothetical protein
MKTKSSLIVLALIVVAMYSMYCMRAASAAPLVNDTEQPRRDLSLLEQRTKFQSTSANNQSGGTSFHYMWGFHPSTFSMDISEAKLSANHQLLKITIAGQKPVVCELRSPCRIVVKPGSPDQIINLGIDDFGTFVFSGGLKVEVFVREQLVLDLTGDEISVGH